MNSGDIKIHALRLRPGQNFKKEIEFFVLNEKIEAGWIQTCVGSLTQTHVRFANKPTGKTANGYFEIVSLAGTVSSNGCHLHISVSDMLGQVTGGHLLYENLVYTTAELIIGESKTLLFTREMDEQSGWKEVQVKKKFDDRW